MGKYTGEMAAVGAGALTAFVPTTIATSIFLEDQ